MADKTEKNYTRFQLWYNTSEQIDQSNPYLVLSANQRARRWLSWWMEESLLKNYCPIVSRFASWDAIMSTSLLWPLNDKQERWVSYFYCDHANEDASLCMCVSMTDKCTACLAPNESARILLCRCTSHVHKLFRIILPCEYQTDKVKLDISTHYVYVYPRVCVCECVCDWDYHWRAKHFL